MQVFDLAKAWESFRASRERHFLSDFWPPCFDAMEALIKTAA